VVNENARQTDLRLTRLFEELTSNFVRKLLEVTAASEKNLTDGNDKVRVSLEECRSELGKKLANTNEYFESYIAEMTQDMKNNSDFEFKAFKVKSNCLEEKMNIIELQLDQVMEVMTKLNTSIANLNR